MSGNCASGVRRCDKRSWTASETGDVDRALLWFGPDAGLVDRVEPAGVIVTRKVRNAQEIITGRLPEMVSGSTKSKT